MNSITDYITHEITIWTLLVIVAITAIFKVFKHIIKEYYETKKFLDKHKISKTELKIKSRKSTIEIEKKLNETSKKIDKLCEAFVIYVKANGVDKKTKDEVLKKLSSDKKTLRVKE